MAEDKLNVPLPRDEVPNKQILNQTIVLTTYEQLNFAILCSIVKS